VIDLALLPEHRAPASVPGCSRRSSRIGRARWQAGAPARREVQPGAAALRTSRLLHRGR
jgi:hypothetical protein